MNRNEKFALLGQLIAEIGYEIRDSQSAIKNTVYLLNMSIENPEVEQNLAILEENVNTSERIINSLLEYVLPKSLNYCKVDINDIIRRALSRTIIPDEVEIALQLNNQLPSILADPNKLAQAFENIICRGLLSFPESGQLIIKSEISSPSCIIISFIGTGTGIREEDLEKLFEPPFITKTKAIGIGLAVSKSIVNSHGGKIEVTSDVVNGSTFKIKLLFQGREDKLHG